MENLIAQIAQTSRLQTLALNRLKALLTEVVGNAERSAILFDGSLQAHKDECSCSEECAAVMAGAVEVVTAPKGCLSAGLHLKESQGGFSDMLKVCCEHMLAATGKFDDTMRVLNRLAQNVQALGELSIRIVAELESTGQIAEKTNALAHKAIHEAQKAGFAGQGFSVIAGEVDRLAVRNKETATNIIPIAVNLRNETSACLDHLSVCLEEAAATDKLLSDNAERIVRLTDSIGHLFKILDQFNDAGRGVTSFTDETLKALQDYAGIVQEHMATLHQLQKMASRLKSALAHAAGYTAFLTETDIGIGLFIDENLPSAANSANGNATAYYLALSGSVRSFDPLFADDSASAEVCRLIYGRLVDIDSAGGLLPGMAFAWESRNDGREWTFYIRKNACFHDGTPISAAEIAESLKRVLSPELRCPASWLLVMIKGAVDYLSGSAPQIEGIEVVDSHTLRFHLDQSYQPFAANLSHVACSVLKIRHEDRDDGSPKPFLVGSGAYQLREVQQQGRNAMLLEAFDNYYKGRPFTSRIIFEINPDREERLAQFLRGNLSHLRLSGSQIRQFQFGMSISASDAGSQRQPSAVGSQPPSHNPSLALRTAFGTFFAGFNLARPGPWRSQGFRKALNYGVDRQKLINDLLAGAGLPAYGPVPPEWLNGAAYPEYEYNPEKAALLLQQCGWNATLEKPLRLFTADAGLFVELAEFLAESFIRIGVPAEIEVLSWEDFQNPVYLAPSHLYIAGWSAETADLDSFLYPLFHSRSRNSGNFGAFIDAYSDRMLKKARAAESAAERTQIYRDLAQHIHKEAPWVFLYHPVHAFAVGNHVRDFELNPLGYVDLAKAWVHKH